jgi:hypothetical protein
MRCRALNPRGELEKEEKKKENARPSSQQRTRPEFLGQPVPWEGGGVRRRRSPFVKGREGRWGLTEARGGMVTAMAGLFKKEATRVSVVCELCRPLVLTPASYFLLPCPSFLRYAT